MKSLFRTSSLLAAGLAIAATSSVHAAGDAAATSGYLTIQPNATNTGYVYTYSWVAPDTDNLSTGVNYTDTRFVNPFGNGGAELDDINTLGGSKYDPDGAGPIIDLRYAWGMSTPGDETVPANTATIVQWVDPANNAIGVVNPTVVTPKHDTVGNFTKIGSFYVASGVQGVTGVYGAASDGSDALAAGAVGAIHTGVGFGVDTDGADDATGTDDFGAFISGFDAVLDPTPTNTMPNTGYVRVEVPFGTAGDDFASRFYTGVFTNNAAQEVTVTTVAEGTYTAKIAVSGDFDGDLDVDNSDIISVAGGFNGASGTGKWYADGDTDADGDVDNADIITTAGNFTGAAAADIASAAGNTIADLLYDPTTGNVTLDADGGANITGFQLESVGAFIDANYISQSGGGYGGVLEDVSDSVLADSDLTFAGLASLDLGNVLATGLDLASLEALLTTADFGAGLGGSGEFEIVVIPEPSSLALLALGGLALVRRRRNA